MRGLTRNGRRWVPNRGTLTDKMIKFLSRPQGATHREVQEEFHIQTLPDARVRVNQDLMKYAHFKDKTGKVIKYKFERTTLPEGQRGKRRGRLQFKIVNGPYVLKPIKGKREKPKGIPPALFVVVQADEFLALAGHKDYPTLVSRTIFDSEDGAEEYISALPRSRKAYVMPLVEYLNRYEKWTYNYENAA